MNRLIHRISTVKVVYNNLNAYKNSAVKKTQQKYKNSFDMDHSEIPYTVESEVFKSNEFLKKLSYKNEQWERVQFRFHDRFLKYFNLPTKSTNNYCADNKTKIVNNNLYFKSTDLKDDWIYYYLRDLSLKNYILNFEAIFYSQFREIQFGFRYQDFYNRYRFRIEDNYLHFDIVRKGQFYNSLLTVPLHLKCDENYKMTIVVKDEKYCFICNGQVIMTVTDKLQLFPEGAVALILWDDSGHSNIHGAFKNIQFNHVS